MDFKLTYSTMFDPPAALHERFETALTRVRNALGASHASFIDGADHALEVAFDLRTPIDRTCVLGRFPDATPAEVDRAMAAAKRAFPAWRRTSPAERNRILRRAAELIEERVYEIGAAVALEVGKNRMEALGEVQETADFFRVYCDDYERGRFEHALPDDPLPDYRSHNRSVMKPYGVWVVITPFNFPFALAGGPVAAALVTGNTVVLKGATDTPWAGRMLADCLRDAGIPPGVFNYVSGSGPVAGEALVNHPDTAGITFTGSHAVGMHIYRRMAAGTWPRPCIAEMGGKNPVIVSAAADLERATLGIVRSAFGLSGQKCSAASRVYVHEAVADELIERLVAQAERIRVGDPTRRENWMGPVINERAWRNYSRYIEELRGGGARILSGGRWLTDGELANGFYCAPTFAEAPLAHPLWQQEMFLPIAMIARVADLDAAMALANDSSLGLTAGFYGAPEEVEWFFDRIEAGVTYANRPQGATTGAWPGYQPFGGWKGSGTSGKGIASAYYLALYQREQSQTLVE
ncbi:MAG TPA: aldehyde dehydrogenase family protein [Steroidobacteraceae bacterium]|jgi:acyl-CoA reductase-like NAD-dependent aldehyde dehydrogenase|nr:aldehyde dehydrogenase family protein [Steroidobacteraceae bacterium]